MAKLAIAHVSAIGDRRTRTRPRHDPMWSPLSMRQMTLAAVVWLAGCASGALPPGLGRMPPGVLVQCEDLELGKEWHFQTVKVTGWSGRGYVVDAVVPRVARTVVSGDVLVPEANTYNVWVHAYLGHRSKPKGCDRSLVLEINRTLLDTTHRGLTGCRFAWELAGTIDVGDNRKAHLRIHDRGDSWAIVDCILLTHDLTFRPEGWTGNSERGATMQQQITAKSIPMPAATPASYPAAARNHVEEVVDSRHSYDVVMGGTLDGFNTVRYTPTYSGYMQQLSAFEPNESLRLENVGEVDVIAPRIVVNGRRNWHSADEILGSVLRPGMADAEKAMAIWAWQSSIEVICHENNKRVGPPFPDDHSNPSRNGFRERADPVRSANCYYCSGCSLSAANFVILCRHAGLTARAIWICPQDRYATHCIAEVWHDGGWHVYDTEKGSFYLKRDNTTLASYKEIHEDIGLAERTHIATFANKDMRDANSEIDRHDPPRGMPVEQWLSSMDMVLRPGESFTWRWDHDGKYRIGDNVRNKGFVPNQLANGKLVYKPDLTRMLFRGRGAAERNILAAAEDGRRPNVRPEQPDAAAWLMVKLESPYPIVGGLVGGRFVRRTEQDTVRLFVSVDQSDWVQVWTADRTGEFEHYVAIDEVLNPKPTDERHAYYAKFEFEARDAADAVGVNALSLEADVQMTGTSLPALSVGRNSVVYSDRSGPGRRARITHGWRESSETRPPSPPAAPLTPGNKGEVALDALKAFSWRAAIDPDGEGIADHHIQVFPREDMLHPVSPNFDRITYSSAPEWALPKGWLVAGREYFWRVRARDAWGAWSPWSDLWRFRVK